MLAGEAVTAPQFKQIWERVVGKELGIEEPDNDYVRDMFIVSLLFAWLRPSNWANTPSRLMLRRVALNSRSCRTSRPGFERCMFLPRPSNPTHYASP